MATYKKMLKNRRGDNIIPAFGGQIDSDDIANGAVTAGKIAPSVLEYQPGDRYTLASGDNTYFAGRTRTQSSNKYVWFQIMLDKPVSSSVSSVAFTPSGYQEVFGPSGAIISRNNPSTSELVITGYVSSYNRKIIYCTMEIKDSTSLTGNLCCSVHIGGTFVFN